MELRSLLLFLFLLWWEAISPLAAQVSAPSLELCRAIMSEIGRTSYDGSLPSIEIMDSETEIARYQNNAIAINRRLFPLCRQWFGEDTAISALAFVIGHELHHHHRMQPCPKIFGFAGPAENEAVSDEHDADLGGLYHACVAGYTDIAKILPALLDSLYRHFQLPDTLEGYKSLEERKQAYTELAAKADTLSRFFMLGNVMMGMRQFDMAEEAFGHILNRGYKVKEVQLHQILASLYGYIYPNGNQIEGEFIFPLELELTIGMNAIKPVGKDRSPEEKKKLDAIIARLEALHQDYPGYERARFYLAVCYALSGNTQLLTLLKNELTPAYHENVELMQALAALKKDRSDAEAKATLRRLSSEAGDARLQKLAAWNLQVLEGTFDYRYNGSGQADCPFPVKKYSKKYGQNMAGIEWEEKEGEVVYGFWIEKGRRDEYTEKCIVLPQPVWDSLIPICSNMWVHPGCSNIVVRVIKNSAYLYDYK